MSGKERRSVEQCLEEQNTKRPPVDLWAISLLPDDLKSEGVGCATYARKAANI
jgi:hypothetical protein